MTSPLPVDPAVPSAVGVALASGGASWEPPLIPRIEQFRSGLRLVRRCVDLADLLAVCRAGLVQVVVVAAGLARLDADDVAGMRALGVSVLVVESSQEPGSALALGATDVVSASVSPDVLVERIRRCAESPSARSEQARVLATTPPPDDAGHGRVVAVCSAAGSPGRSTLAVGAAGLLARRGRPAMLVDADVAGGAVSTLLGMVDDTPGLPAACRSAARGRLDPAVLAAHAVAVSDQMRVLTAAPRPDRWRELRPSALRTVLSTARSLADVVVVDCGAGLPDVEREPYPASSPGAVTAAVLAEADVALLVASADPVGMVRLGHLLESVDEVMPDTSPVLVVTRVRGSVVGRHPEAQVRQTLARVAPGLRAHLLPDDPEAVDRAARRGEPVVDVAPASDLARALEVLVADVIDPEVSGASVSEAAGRPRPSRRWARRRRSIA